MKYFAETQSSIMEKIRAKKKQLTKVLNSDYPKADSKIEGHKRRIKNALIFWNDLLALEMEICSTEYANLPIKMVDKKTFDKTVKELKTFVVCPDMDFCKVATVYNGISMMEDYVLIWISPISSL